MVLVLIRCLAWKIRCVIDIALLFYFFVTIICESGDKTNIKAARRAYYIEAEVVKILPEESTDIFVLYPNISNPLMFKLLHLKILFKLNLIIFHVTLKYGFIYLFSLSEDFRPKHTMNWLQ